MLCQCFQQVEVAAGKCFLKVFHDIGVVKRIGNVVALTCFTIWQADVQVDLDRLRHNAFPVVDADEYVDLEFAQKDDVHCCCLKKKESRKIRAFAF